MHAISVAISAEEEAQIFLGPFSDREEETFGKCCKKRLKEKKLLPKGTEETADCVDEHVSS